MRRNAIQVMYASIIVWAAALIMPAYAATYYISPSGNDSSGNGSSGSPWKTFSKGIGTMSGGDTLIAKNGTYAERITGMPSGSAGAYTQIKAESDFGVELTPSSGSAVDISGKSYVKIQGFKLYGGGNPRCYIHGSHHIKIIRCVSNFGGGGMSAGFTVQEGSQYVLFEECVGYGGGRYFFMAYGGNDQSDMYIVFRRCLVRWDCSGSTDALAGFAAYNANYVSFQNCVMIDAKDVNENTGGVYRGITAFATPNGAAHIDYRGCIVLNVEGSAFHFERSPVSDITIDNCIAWDLIDNDSGETYKPSQFCRAEQEGGSGPVTITNCTTGTIEATAAIGFGGEYIEADTASITNTILYAYTLLSGTYVIQQGLSSENYNSFYGNTGGRNSRWSLGGNDITNHNPLGSSLKYLPRIESGSVLKSAGSGGTQIGAGVLYQIGTSGTLYGESGWNTLTALPLWPFPNEDAIRTEVRSFYAAAGDLYPGSPPVDGKRGFAADGQTLTKYIWEYLGTTIPDEIYGGGSPSDTTAPSAVTDLTAGPGANPGEITLGWTSPGDDGTSGTASAYIVKYAASAITTDGAFNTASAVAGVPAPASAGTIQTITIAGFTPGQTYYFALKTQDEVPNTAALSNSPGAAAKTSTAADTTSPAAVTNLAAAPGANAGEINLSWTAPGDDGATGTASDYTIKYSTSPITTDTLFTNASGLAGLPLPAAAGTVQSKTIAGLTPGTTYYFAIKTRDEVPNTSALSNSAAAAAKSTVNNAPVLAAIGSKNVNENALLAFTVHATDADNDALTYAASGLPSGATFANRNFTWMPSFAQAGNYTVGFNVSDGRGMTDSETITIAVANVNRAPTLTAVGNKTAFVNTTLSFSLSATDPDADPITYSATGIPQGATLNTASGAFSWKPSDTQTGNYTVTFKAADSSGASDSKNSVINVQTTDNQTPYISAANPQANEVQIPLDTNIAVHIKDDGKGVDINTVSLSVQREGDAAAANIVVNGTNQLSGYSNSVTILGAPEDYTIVYDPPYAANYRFGYEQTITVRVNAKDLAGNIMPAQAYSFTTAMMVRGRDRKISRR